MSNNSTDEESEKTPIEKAMAGLAMRSIGPAFMGGRIADIAIHPSRPTTWYVAVGSGGVWRTDNAGITWKPLFDEQPSYSIGCVRIDPSHPEVIWVGTGEAVSGRHVAWGDGVYRSDDGGESWLQIGLERSEHISDILIDPRDGNVVYVAAEGPLWSSGGERGLYKTTDGGATWELVLSVDDDTGVTSAVFAPDDPDVIYAATYQRRRRVWSFLGGGPGSGIHTSSDRGQTWTKATKGLPEGEMGRIGLAVTPAAPEIVYATIEAADEKEKGFYRSTNRGRTWERRNEYLSGGTGPHYYQELFASPTDADKVYQVDVFLHVTIDGGKTFRNMETGKHKHSDNHVLWIDPHNGQHLIVGCDAGLYETFDDGEAWRHVPNLPISQFYRVAVDNSVPFTNILGGAQDLGTLRGPTRTLHVDGVRNQDWSVTLGADGYQVAFDPDDNDISYMEWQIGNVMRHDGRTMELEDIQPQAGPDDPPERWNWDTPIVISPHAPNRIYVASQRLWRSEDRGDSWTPISPDLTRNRNRLELATGDRVVSVDSIFDHMAMSFYSTITAVAESPVEEGVIYVGTDDGRIQVTEDGGATWREAARPDGLSEFAFINDIEASQHDGDVVIIATDDHKSGDYRPYLFESRDRGRTWRSIAGDLPEATTIWAIEQDHVKADLLFVGAEHGVHVSLDGGERWHKLTKGVPTISFRDLAIQRRDNDLVGATFGRGFYVLDDYAPLRELSEDALAAPAALLPVRDAWWYVPYQPMQAVDQPTLGTTAFRTPNPEFGATVTYHLSEEIRSAKGTRREAEKEQDTSGTDVPFPGWDTLRDEHREVDPVVALVVRNADGDAIRHVPAESKPGLHRTSWDLRLPAPDPVKLAKPEFEPPWVTDPKGPLVEPGSYSVELVRLSAAGVELLAGPEQFSVVPTPAVSAAQGDAGDFRRRSTDLARRVAGAAKQIESARDRIRHVRAGISATPAAADLLPRLESVHVAIEDAAVTLMGDPVLEKMNEPARPSVRELVGRVVSNHRNNTGPPTATQRATIDQVAANFETIVPELAAAHDELAALTAELDAAGGPWTPR
ncbi:MAG: glycosyl hydrolase [Acidimicrobiales bacterium]|nr:glycosyl hydrolase [Acidimicrobiales bacterium]